MAVSQYVLYILSFPNGKKYIGQTNNYILRMQQHKSAAIRIKGKKQTLVDRAILKYGWDNIKRSILLKCNENFIDEYERRFISLYNSQVGGNGYNLDSGGNSNKRHSEETKQKISKSHIGIRPSAEALIKMSLSKTGKKRSPHTEETKLKMSLASKGRPKSEDHKKQLSICKSGKKRHSFTEDHKNKISKSNIEAWKCKNKSFHRTDGKVWLDRKIV